MNQITEPIIQLINGKNFAYISTLMKDGSPQVTPTWIAIDGMDKYPYRSSDEKKSHPKDKARKSVLSTAAFIIVTG